MLEQPTHLWWIRLVGTSKPPTLGRASLSWKLGVLGDLCEGQSWNCSVASSL